MADNDNKSIELHSGNGACREDLLTLIDRVSFLIQEKESLLNHGNKHALMTYYSLLGNDQLELLHIEVELRKLKYFCELIQSKLNASQEVDLEVIRAKVELELQEWKEKIEEMKAGIKLSSIYNKNLLSPEESKELRSLYRSLVKSLHPDINKDLTPQHTEMWLAVQNAFKNGDIQTLRNISVIVNNAQQASVSGSENEIKSMIEDIKERIILLEQEIDMIKHSFPYTMLEKLQDNEWVEKEKLLINQKMQVFREQIVFYQNRLETLQVICYNGRISKN
jgi:hypothetical protein